MFRARTINEKTVQAAITGSGEIVSFTSAFEKPLSELILNIEPVQSGSGDPSPTNIRPISGWTGTAIYRRCKNFIHQSLNALVPGYTTTDHGITYTINDDMSVTCNGTATATSMINLTASAATAHVPLPKGDYILSGCPSGSGSSSYSLRIRTQNVGGGNTTFLRDSGNGASFSVTDTREAARVYIEIANGTVCNDVTFYPMIRKASDPKEPYKPWGSVGGNIAYPITWSDTAGTVYGGALDVARGKLTVTRKDILLSSLTWQRRGVRLFSANLPSGESADPTVPISEHLCDYFPTEYVPSYTSVQTLHLAFYKTASIVASGTVYLRLTSTEISDSTAEFNQWLIDNPAHLCYKLVTPIEYDLDPTTISTLLGQNNVWADTGDIAQLAVDPITGKLKFKLIQ